MPNTTLRPESVLVAAGRPPEPGAPLNPSIVLTASFRHDGTRAPYLRQDGNETMHAFEQAMGQLEGGAALAFASGMAAVSAVTESRPAGAVIVAPDGGFSGTALLLRDYARAGRGSVREVNVADTAAVTEALVGADLLWVETPANPLLEVADLPALVAAAHRVGALICVDTTFATPLLLRPLEHGADLVMHSATKYLSGHSDLLM
ncbi:MAG: PLP-dependent transferase, partial [Actinomycetia bacterium]|nr:PLP-dependent transferase [Actinomycetes bacterium]